MVDQENFFSNNTTFWQKDAPDEPAKPISQYEASLQDKITINQKLKVGDRVLLKGRNCEVVVTHVDYIMQGVGKIPYIGQVQEGPFKGQLKVFGQYDIERIISSKEEKEGKGEEKEK